MSTVDDRKAAVIRVRRFILAAALSVAGLSGLAGAAQAAAAPEPAWKPFAVTGPTNVPPRQSEVQRVTAEAEGGEFTLSQTTEGKGTISKSSEEVTAVSVPVGEFHPGDPISGTGIPAGTTIVSVGGATLMLSQFPTKAGTGVALTTTEVTAPIAYDASAAQVQDALEALPALTDGAVTVRIEPGLGSDVEHIWFVDFGGRESEGPYALRNVPQLVAAGGLLVGEHAAAQVFTTVPGGNGTGEIAVYPINVGGRSSSGAVTVEVGPLPSGIVLAGGIKKAPGDPWSCSAVAGAANAKCAMSSPIPGSGDAFPAHLTFLKLPIEVESVTPTHTSTDVTVSGAEGGSATIGVPIVISSFDAPFGIQSFWAGAYEADGEPSTQAGGHPASAVSDFALNTFRTPSGKIRPVEDPKEEIVDLPAGFVGDPLTTERCPQFLVAPITGSPNSVCGNQDAVGVLGPVITEFGQEPHGPSRLFNDIPARGTAAEFSGLIASPIQSLVGSVRSSEDFGVRISAPFNPTFEQIFGAYVALEGTPTAAHGLSFLTNPTDCSVQREESEQGRGPATVLRVSSWPRPTAFSRAEDPLPLLTGCRALTEAWLGHGPEPEKEEPSFSFRPTTTQASSPTGATALLHIPQDGLTDPNKLATSDLKKTVVTLPQGVSVNPSSANGLQACSEAQVGYIPEAFTSPNPTHFSEEPVSCPDASKLGSFTIKTPLLEEEVEGTIYLAAQEENPFDSLLALYLVVENERFGFILKLPGEVKPDPATGQLTATFDNNPQLPFEDLTLNFRGGGPRSTLATPETCGHFETTGSLEPWSAENGEALPIHEAGFSTTGTCASSDGARPFAPSFEAGTTGTQAGAYSPLVIKLSRQDGEQELRSLDFTLPKGLTGKLAGIPYCPESAIAEAEAKSGKAEQSSASCPAASQIGSVDTGAGIGSEPLHVGGKVYLAGPYKGAPLSSVVVTPAVAGPFDLGDVVIRAPLFVDPETTEITAKSDPIPTILKGIPLKVRSVAINLDRSDFTLNPTSCNVMLAAASIGGSSGATASPTSRFQVGGCKSLKFKPRLKLSLKGSTKHAGHPALKAVLTYPKQGAYANIRRAQVNLPHSEFIDQGNLDKTCTKPVLLEGKCPKRSIYGKAKAWTPLLEKPLEGPVYLVGGYGYKLPALVAELNGQIRVVLKGKVDSGPNKGIRNTFEAVPDAPVERFVLEMKGGKKYSLLENSENLCQKPQRAIARFTAQNGAVLQAKPLIANQCGKSKKRRTSHGKADKH